MKKNLVLKIAALISALSGVIILTGVLYPIVSYDLTYSKKYSQLVSPLVNKNSTTIEEIDYTRASNWFVGGVDKLGFMTSNIEYYTISIPKLKIDKATVAIGGEDLASHIIQYPGTALPGKRGNSVLFGHSILPIFYNPKNYISIFSLLPQLENGDEIFVDYDGASYVYKVETLFEVLPTDIQILDQDSTDSFLTLVTCTPPGDPRKPKRLVVRARVVPPDELTTRL